MEFDKLVVFIPQASLWVFRHKFITEIIIPKNIIKIGRRVFSGCPNLTNIIIPDSVTTIADYAFCECNSLSSVTYKGITYINKWMLIKNLEENGVVIGCDAFHHTRLQS